MEEVNNCLRAVAPPHPLHYAGLSVWLEHGWPHTPEVEAALKAASGRAAQRWQEFKATLP